LRGRAAEAQRWVASEFEDHMKDAKSKQTNLWRAIGFGAYFGVVSSVVRFILVDGFSITVPYAFSIAVLAAVLSGYPLFVRGTVNLWRKDTRQWSFLPWAAFGFLAAAAAFLVLHVLEL
jgi:hypothetical protein